MRDVFRSQPVVDGSLSGGRVTLVLLLSGCFGFCLGLSHSSWQVAVEGAQVVAGIVHYPRQNPFYIYQTKTWTLLHQMGALFLHFGASEKTISLFLSGLVGAVCFQALSLYVLGLSGDSLLAIASPLLIFSVKGTHIEGIHYPVMLMGTDHTYGMLGLSFILLVAALIGVGQYKPGGLLLGIAPAVHPSLGMWFSLVALTCLIWGFRYLGDAFRRAGKFILIGYSISAVSLVFHLLVTYDVPKITSDIASGYLSAFGRYWDGHRPEAAAGLSIIEVLKLSSDSTFAIIVGLIASLLWLLLFNRDISRSSRFLLYSFVTSAVTGGAVYLINCLLPETVPDFLLILMPARLLNFNVLSSFVLLLGLLGRYRDNVWVQLNLITLVGMLYFLPPRFHAAGMVLSGFALALSVSFLKPYVNEHHLRCVLNLEGMLFITYSSFLLCSKSLNPVFFGRYSLIKLSSIFFFYVAGALILLFSNLSNKTAHDASRLFRKLSVWLSRTRLEGLPEKLLSLRLLRGTTLAVLGLIVIRVGIGAYSQWEQRKGFFRDWTNDPLFAEASKGQGMLLTCSNMRLIQLRTRRPVLLDGGSLDLLPYTLEAGPEMNRVLRQVYGVDLFNPPEEIKATRPGALLSATGKGLWESRSAGEWGEIGRQFGVSDVLCYRDWKLQLPEIVRSNEFVLYGIP